MSCSTSLRCIRRIYVRACMPPVLQKNEGRSVDWIMRWPARVKSTAGEDETCEENPGNSNGDAFDVAPPVPAPGDESAAETAAAEPAPGRHQDATRTPPGRHQDATRTPPGRHQDATRTPPGRHQDATRTPPGRHQDATRTPPGRHQDATRTPPGRHQDHQDATRTPPGPIVQELFIPDDRQPHASRSLSAGHMAKRPEIGNSSSRSMPPKRTVCYQQREWQPAHFLGKDYHAHSVQGVEIERQWFCFSPLMKKPYCQSCCLFGDPSAMQKEWANGVSGNPKNFEVKIKSHEKTQAHLDASIAFGRWKTGNALGDGRRATHWSRSRIGNRDRGDLLSEVFCFGS